MSPSNVSSRTDMTRADARGMDWDGGRGEVGSDHT
jgi:hypothetical protein